MIIFHPIPPCSAPRQCRKDAWDPSPHVRRYRTFRDDVAKLGVKLPADFYHIVFLLPMPKSWSNKRRREMNLTPHTSRPDKNNLEKALEDAVYRFGDDAHIWNSHSTKVWHYTGGMIVSSSVLSVTPAGIDSALRLCGNLA